MHLGLVGQQLSEHATEPDRLGGELAVTSVRLVEDQIDGREDIGESLRKRAVPRDTKRDPRLLDLRSCAGEAFRHDRGRNA